MGCIFAQPFDSLYSSVLPPTPLVTSPLLTPLSPARFPRFATCTLPYRPSPLLSGHISPSSPSSQSHCVYLGAACLPLNVVENQTTVGRLCRLELRECDGAFMAHWCQQCNKAIPPFLLSSGSNTQQFCFPRTHPEEGSERHRQEDRPPDPRVLFSPSRAPCFKSDATLAPVGTFHD